MNRCEQELCPFWAGNDGCACAVFDITETERRKQQRAIGIRVPDDEPDAWDECADCGHDRDDHTPDTCTGTNHCRCPGFLETDT